MAQHPRLEELRRRVAKDPASIAFAQLAEEYRRAGELQEAIAVCRTGLEIHPSYLSARVTLGRALLELDRLDAAHDEFERVLTNAPENLSAIRGLAEIHHRRGTIVEALMYYRQALSLARNDPDLEQTVADLARAVGPALAPEAALGSVHDEPVASLVQDTTAVPLVPTDAAVDPAVGAATRTIAALEQWLAAIHVVRAERRA